MIPTKSKSELALMRHAGLIVAKVHHGLKGMVRPGVSTWELDTWAEDLIRSEGASPTFKGYHSFPASLCTSVNEQVVHGIPSKSVVLRKGDIIGVDVGATYRGYVGDSAWTYAVGEIDPKVQALLVATEEALWRAIDAARVGNRVSDIGHAVESYIAPLGYGIVQEFCGHGVGAQMHEEPQVPNYGRPGRGKRLKAGYCLALEPMINLGVADTKILGDSWTVVTVDGLPSAHFEHTVAMTTKGPRIMTAATEALSYKFIESDG